MDRPQAAALLGCALGLVALGAGDRSAREARAVADGRFDRWFFRGFSEAEPGAGRVGGPDSELVLQGLWKDAPLDVVATIASALPKGQIVAVHSNGVLVETRDVGGRLGTLRFAARADAAGVLRLRFIGDGQPAPAVRVARVEVVRSGPGEVPVRSLALYGGLLGLIAFGAHTARRGMALSFGLPVLAASVLLAALRMERLVVLAHLPLLLAALFLGLGAYVLSRAMALPAGASAWIAASLALRGFLGLHPAFPGVDLSFHAHNVLRLLAGEAVQSHVANPAGPGTLAIPYPPLLYYLIAPFVSSEDSAVTALKVVMVLLEGSAPWLMVALLRAAGASETARSAAAVSLAVMPEGVLVLAKGIAANALGSWLALWVLWAVIGRAPFPLVALLATAAFLAHPGAAATLVLLLALHAAWEARAGRLARGRAGGLAGAVAAAAGLAWLAYYRGVSAATAESLSSLGSHMREAPGAFFAFRGIHALKVAQNLLLKLGGGPVVLAAAGLRRARGERGAALASLWLAASGALALLAVMTPLAFRFEYFASPAVALAAGLGASAWQQAGKGRLVTALWTLAFGLQVVIGVALLLGRFELISVIIPSSRWAWPLRLW